jgi:hypothetical protein
VILFDSVLHMDDSEFYITSIENYKATIKQNDHAKIERMFNEKMPLLLEHEYSKIIQDIKKNVFDYSPEIERILTQQIHVILNKESTIITRRLRELIDMTSIYSHKIELDRAQIEQIVKNQIQTIIDHERGNIATRINDVINLTKYLVPGALYL